MAAMRRISFLHDFVPFLAAGVATAACTGHALAQLDPGAVTCSARAVFVAAAEDEAGRGLLFFMDARNSNVLGPLVGPPPRRGPGLFPDTAPGRVGTLIYAPTAASAAPAASGGRVLGFAPAGSSWTAADLVARVEDPLLLGLLAGRAELRESAYARVLALEGASAQQGAVAGLLLAKADGLAEAYLETLRVRGPGDPVLTEWRQRVTLVRRGLSAWVDSVDPNAPASSDPVLGALLPAARAWVRGDREGSEAAIYEALLSRKLTGVGTDPERAPMSCAEVVDRCADWPFLLARSAPGFHALVRSVLRTTSNDLDLLALGVDPDPAAGLPVLAFVSPGQARIGRVPWPPDASVRPPEFGAPLRLVLKDRGTGSPYAGGRYRLIRIQVGTSGSDSQKRTLQALQAVSFTGRDESGYATALAFLSRAARQGWGGYDWERWQSDVSREGTPKWFTGLETVLRLEPWSVTARQAERALRRVTGRKQFGAVGGAGFAIAGVHWRNGDLAGLGRWLDELDRLIPSSGETYDGQGDPGPENRLALIAWRAMLNWRTGRPVLWPTAADRRQAGVFLIDLAQDWTPREREEWQLALYGAGWPR